MQAGRHYKDEKRFEGYKQLPSNYVMIMVLPEMLWEKFIYDTVIFFVTTIQKQR